MLDWIKWEKTLPDKPKVLAIAEHLKIDRFAVAGRLMAVWSWADSHSTDGKFPVTLGALQSVTVHAMIELITGRNDFAKAMEKVGWLKTENGRVCFPDFEKHNSQSAKRRALTAKRVQRHRGKNRAQTCNASVTLGALPEKRREEKRREDSIAPPKGGVSPSSKKDKFTKDKKKPTGKIPSIVWEMAKVAEEATGKPFSPLWGRDGSAVKRHAHLGEDEILARWRCFVEEVSDDEWLRKHFSIAYFCGQINSFGNGGQSTKRKARHRREDYPEPHKKLPRLS